MKFKKFGKALLMTAVSAGIVFGVTSCVQSFTVGFLYVTGTETASTTGQGVISGFKIDHNTGNLSTIAGLPISSGGSNPIRIVLLTGGRFVYVLNRGTTADGGPCSTTDVCSDANITQFAVGGNGILTPQATYFTQGHNPFRLIPDTSGTHLFALDHDSPDSKGCSLVFGPSVTTCGDITAFSIDPVTGRLTYVLNSQVTAASGAPLAYFPVPANPIDFAFSANFIITLSGTPGTGDSAFPYSTNTSGQLTINQNSSQPLGMSHGTAIVVAGSVTYVLDDGPNTNTPSSNGQVFAFTLGTNGALQAEANGYYPDNGNYSYPNWIIVAANKWLYLLNQGDNANTNIPQSGIASFQILSPYQLQPIPNGGQNPGTGPGPQCIVEDPSNQYVYTANFNNSAISALSIHESDGILTPLSQATKAKDSYALPGPGTWCIVSGRTN